MLGTICPVLGSMKSPSAVLGAASRISALVVTQRFGRRSRSSAVTIREILLSAPTAVRISFATRATSSASAAAFSAAAAPLALVATLELFTSLVNTRPGTATASDNPAFV